jgi:ribosomal protein L11 methyltransferase
MAEVPAAAVDELVGRAWAAGAAGIEERPAADDRVTLVVSVPSDQVGSVEAALVGHEVTREDVDAEAGLDEWRRWATAWRIDQIEVRPAWHDEASSATRHSIAIDPGRAFGSGSHPSTRLALAALQRLDLQDATVLDIGTGTGVLAIAVALLGARWVAAVDIDPAAVEIAAGNAQRNGVDDRLGVSGDEVGSVRGGPFDVVVANVTAGVLVELATEVSGHLRPGGHLVLSGLLVDQRAAVLEAYPALRLLAEDTDGEWAGLVLSR